MSRLAVPLVLLLAMACSGGSEVVADVDINETCELFAEATTPIERRVVETDLVDQIASASDDEDDTAVLEVLASLQEACPDVAEELLGTGDAELASTVSLDLGACGSDEVDGEVINNGEVPVNVRILVRFTDDDDVLLDTRTTSVSGLEPGQTGKWNVFAPDPYDRCRAVVDSVVPS